VTGPSSGRVRWRRQLEGAITPGVVISAGDVAYAASNAGVLHAISVATGRDVWTFNGGASYGSDLSTSALLRSDGQIIWPGPRDRIYGLDGRGRVLWTLPTRGQGLTPVIDPATGQLIVADTGGDICGYRLSLGTGRPHLVWSHRLGTSSYGNPSVAADGTIYETAGDSLFAISASGTLRWTQRTPDSVEVSPAIAQNGIVVFGSNNRDEYGVNPNGSLRWRVPIGNYTYSSPLGLPGRRVAFGNHSGQLKILDSDTGRELRVDTGMGQIWTAPAVDARGDVYFATRDGYVYGFSATGRRQFAISTGSQFDAYPAIAPDGTLLIGSEAGVLYAIDG
jgi:outer membrane protein assembly factor BamB